MGVESVTWIDRQKRRIGWRLEVVGEAGMDVGGVEEGRRVCQHCRRVCKNCCQECDCE